MHPGEEAEFAFAYYGLTDLERGIGTELEMTVCIIAWNTVCQTKRCSATAYRVSWGERTLE